MTFLRVSDIADVLGVSQQRVYQRIRSGEIPAVKVGQAVRIRREDWERWLEENVRPIEPKPC